MIRRLLWLLMGVVPKLTGNEPEKDKEQRVPYIPAGQHVWVKVKPIKSKPIGVIMDTSIIEGRIIWLWCRKAEGTK